MRFARSAFFARAASGAIVTGLMLGLAAPVLAQDGAVAADVGADDAPAIVVTGARLATRAAIGEKRSADNFVETLRANDVGKLPDQNVAEAVKRLPGLSSKSRKEF